MFKKLLFRASATTKIAAIFDTESAAATAAATLHAETGIQAAQLRLIKPHDQAYSKRLAPETRGIALTFFDTVASRLMGGLITARPDHQAVIQRIRDATQQGQWSLVVHPHGPKQREATMIVLTRLSPEIVCSL